MLLIPRQVKNVDAKHVWGCLYVCADGQYLRLMYYSWEVMIDVIMKMIICKMDLCVLAVVTQKNVTAAIPKCRIVATSTMVESHKRCDKWRGPSGGGLAAINTCLCVSVCMSVQVTVPRWCVYAYPTRICKSTCARRHACVCVCVCRWMLTCVMHQVCGDAQHSSSHRSIQKSAGHHAERL